ncbi:MAG: cyd operon YbgE family protein [Pseudomonadota bacterium]|nr:cyd operon YbgE family protein [Pseudomonadota bacterium]
MAGPVNYKDYGPLYAGWARMLSLLVALALSGMLMFTRHDAWVSYPVLDRTLLGLTFWGIIAGYIHGVGYVPVWKIWRYIFSPYVAWPLLLTGVLWWNS